MMAKAVAESRIVLTFDLDFGDILTAAGSQGPSVMIFRLRSQTPAVNPQALAALLRVGWSVKRQSGSHRVLTRTGWPDYEFAFRDRDEIRGRMLARVAKRTGLKPEDL
jgi:predicted RNA binding protein YcfA (HicA-like mRNA interferase family)